MNFGEKLKQLRQGRNWSQPELAEAIGIEQSYLSKLENDKSQPSPDMLNRIIETFDIDVDTLLEGMDEAEIRNQLRSIPLINEHLQNQQARTQRKRTHWIMGSSLLCVLGISTLFLGFSYMAIPTVIYGYDSEEIVPHGSSGETFESLTAFLDHEFSPTRIELGSSSNAAAIEAYETLRVKYSTLSIPSYRVSYQYLGNGFIEELSSDQDLINLQATGQSSGGSRTFELSEIREETRIDGPDLSFAGAFLLALGIFGFITDTRLNSIKK